MGNVPADPPLSPDPSTEQAPTRTMRPLLAGGVAVGVAIIGVLIVLAGRPSPDNSTTNPTTTTAQPAVTAGPGWSRSDAETVGALATAVTESSAARALSTTTVLAVERCAIPLTEAATQLDTVIVQRRSTLDDLRELDTNGGLALATESLTEALWYSLLADEARQRWVEWLAARWGATYTSGCWPAGDTPLDANVDVAQVQSANAAVARTEFLTLFNPFAVAAGLRTWDPSEF